MERTCEGVIVLTQPEEGRRLRVVCCLYFMNRRPHAGGYVYDGTGVNQFRLPGPVHEIRALLPALTQAGRRVLSFIERGCGWDVRSECISLSCCWTPSIRERRPRYK